MVSLRRRVATATVAVVLATAAGTSSGPPAGAASRSDRCYTAALHQVFLDRPASVYDLEAWIDRYTPVPARPALPRALAVSDEWLEAVVVGIYDDALDRAPDPLGLTYWIERLRAGARVTTLTAQVYGSAEVWTRAGATAEGFVADVFPRIMGRAPSTDDVAYWAGEVPGRSRGGVAKALVGSIENRRDRVTALYDTVLGRAPDPAGRDYWAGRLATLDDVALAVHLASSPEAYQQAQVGCAVPPAPTTTIMGTVGNGSSSFTPKVSGDGRDVAFLSAAPLLPGGRADSTRDLYLLDRTTGALTRAVEADADVGAIALAGDGRHVAFVSQATDLVPGEGTAPADVYSWDRTTGTVTRVTDGDGTTDSLVSEPSISDDGRFIAFGTYATLGPDDPAGEDAFVWDRTTDTLTRLEDAGVDSDPLITPDGAHVLYSSLDPVAPGDTPDATDVFSWARATGTITWVGPGTPQSVAADGDVVASQGAVLHLIDAQTGEVTPITDRADGFSGDPHIARDGATVSFTSWGPGLFPGDTPNSPDVFVWERATGTIVRINPRGSDASASSTSADGRVVVFQSAPRQPDGRPAQVTVWDRRS